jgi:hypothetical protein
VTYINFETFDIVPKEEATGAIVAEYDADGNMTQEAFGQIGGRV